MADDLGDSQAAYMVDLLRLNSPNLRGGRKLALMKAFDADFLSTMTADELRVLRTNFRGIGPDGQAQNFGHVLTRFIGQRLDDVPHSSGAL